MSFNLTCDIIDPQAKPGDRYRHVLVGSVPLAQVGTLDTFRILLGTEPQLPASVLAVQGISPCFERYAAWYRDRRAPDRRYYDRVVASGNNPDDSQTWEEYCREEHAEVEQRLQELKDRLVEAEAAGLVVEWEFI